MPPSVLIVDDHEDIRRSARALLPAEGFVVVGDAADGGRRSPRLTNVAIATRLFVTERTVEAHTKQIFGKLRLEADPGSNRRVLAVLAFLRAPGR
jgi:DNA-binding NarL/FixJ family response regulator